MNALAAGQQLEAGGRLAEAIDCYDRAIAESHGDARRHGVAWMNRGNALQKLAAATPAGPPRAVAFAAALAAYDHAIASFRRLPVATDTLARNHLGAAWLNRGHLQLIAADTAGAAAAFAEAIAWLERLPLESDPHFRLNLAGARVNLAHVLLATAPDAARASAQAALTALAGHERQHPLFAEIGLRARRAFVLSLGPQADSDQIAAATDAIEEGLAVARDWDRLGVTGHRPLALRLFRLGAQLYHRHQPQFLAEFVLEQVAAVPAEDDPGFRAEGAAAIDLALVELRRPRFVSLDDDDAPRLLETAAALRRALQHLSLSQSDQPPSLA